jgi:hypothetical protein
MKPMLPIFHTKKVKEEITLCSLEKSNFISLVFSAGYLILLSVRTTNGVFFRLEGKAFPLGYSFILDFFLSYLRIKENVMCLLEKEKREKN